jgi:2C-methyl-D-erythritol 2,4-cyclodiphosphate synthase
MRNWRKLKRIYNRFNKNRHNRKGADKNSNLAQPHLSRYIKKEGVAAVEATSQIKSKKYEKYRNNMYMSITLKLNISIISLKLLIIIKMESSQSTKAAIRNWLAERFSPSALVFSSSGVRETLLK